MSALKLQIQKHFDFSTDPNDQWYEGDRFKSKHPSSLEDLLEEIMAEHEKEVHDLREQLEGVEDQVKDLEAKVQERDEEIEELKDGGIRKP